MPHKSTKKHNPNDQPPWHPRHGDRSVVREGTLLRYAHYLDLSQKEIAIRCGLRPDSSLIRKWLSLGQNAQHRPMPRAAFGKLLEATETPATWAEIKAAEPIMGYAEGFASAVEDAVFSHPVIQKREAEHIARAFKELTARMSA